MLSTRRRFFEATRSPATAALRVPALFPALVSTDNLPPTQPGTPVGTAISTSQINWTWTASTDSGGSGLAGYRVYLDGASTPTTTVTTNAYSSTGHTASTSHTLRVEAFDNAGNSISSGTGSQTTQASGGASFTPLFVGKFDVGTNGQPCNTEYVQYSAAANPIIYTNEVTGPFGEPKVGKVQLLDYVTNHINGYYYGGYPKIPSLIPATENSELWGRIYMRFPTSYCFGGQGQPAGYPENVNGALKFFRLFFDTSNRLTLLLGSNENSSIWMNQGVCGNTATTPVIGAVNSEIVSVNYAASNLVTLTRDTWFAIQWYVRFNTSGGIFRVWVNDTRIVNATNAVTRPSGASTVAQGFAMPGDYYNGAPQNFGMFAYVANMVIATSASPPTTLDGLVGSGGVPFISPSLDARTL